MPPLRPRHRRQGAVSYIKVSLWENHEMKTTHSPPNRVDTTIEFSESGIVRFRLILFSRNWWFSHWRAGRWFRFFFSWYRRRSQTVDKREDVSYKLKYIIYFIYRSIAAAVAWRNIFAIFPCPSRIKYEKWQDYRLSLNANLASNSLQFFSVFFCHREAHWRSALTSKRAAFSQTNAIRFQQRLFTFTHVNCQIIFVFCASVTAADNKTFILRFPRREHWTWHSISANVHIFFPISISISSAIKPSGTIVSS